MGEQEYRKTEAVQGEKSEFGDVLEKLVEYQKESGEKNTLIMLALLNLLGIVGSLNRMESKDGRGNSPFGQLPFNPAMLLSLLGGVQGSGQGKGQGFDLSSLMGLLGNLMGGMPGGVMAPQQHSKQEKAAAGAGNTVGKNAGKMKVEKNVTQPENKDGQQAKLKGRPPAQGTVKGHPADVQKAQPKKHEVIKWDFGEKDRG